MTSATNPRRPGPTPGHPTPGLPTPRGFTLLELLLVVGIIGLLMGILLPAVSRTYARALRLRTQADLAAIATGLEAYKADFGTYPPVTSANSGAAVLGKALLGPYDAAHYYTGNPGALTANDTLQNPPPAYAAGTIYNAGDVVLGATPPTYAVFTSGLPAPGADVWVCVRNNTQADGMAHAPADGSSWWARFLPYDGNDGAGVKARLATVTDNATGLPHGAGGKVYGPYLDVDRFKTRGPVILDRYDSPVLYFPLNKAANPSTALGFVNGYSYPRVVSPAPGETLSMLNVNDNVGAFENDTVSGETFPMQMAKVQLMLGDFNLNGANDAATEPPLPPAPFVLWTAGPDKVFGPRGTEASTATNTSASAQNFFSTTGHARDNQTVADAVDDVTNFR